MISNFLIVHFNHNFQDSILAAYIILRVQTAPLILKMMIISIIINNKERNSFKIKKRRGLNFKRKGRKEIKKLEKEGILVLWFKI